MAAKPTDRRTDKRKGDENVRLRAASARHSELGHLISWRRGFDSFRGASNSFLLSPGSTSKAIVLISSSESKCRLDTNSKRD